MEVAAMQGPHGGRMEAVWRIQRCRGRMEAAWRLQRCRGRMEAVWRFRDAHGGRERACMRGDAAWMHILGEASHLLETPLHHIFAICVCVVVHLAGKKCV